MKNKILLLLLILCSAISMQSNAAEKNPKPFVIPELREWTGATGEFTITKETRIVYSRKNAELAEIASLFAEDYKKMTGVELQVVEGNAKTGDIKIAIKRNKKIGDEGYITVDMSAFNLYDEVITITAGEYSGTYDLAAYIAGVTEKHAGEENVEALLLALYNYCKEADEYNAYCEVHGELN